MKLTRTTVRHEINAREGETIFSCPHTFKFRTRLLTGTTSGMASDCVRFRGGGGGEFDGASLEIKS